MMEPREAVEKWKEKLGRRGMTAFVSAVVFGLLIHLPAMLSDYPNHDGLSSIYFDQNMITSGRWFLTVACGFSSFYTVPWVIGLLGLFFLGCTSAALAELLDLKSSGVTILCGGLLAAFPAMASTFAYVFTLDGYMLAMFLAVLAVLLTGKYRFGFLPGALCLAFSMGIYQAYLPFAILLSLGQVLLILGGEEFAGDVKGGLIKIGKYLGMGLLGVAAYYVILQALLLLQGKKLDTYQGMDTAGRLGAGEFLQGIRAVYTDFAAFSLKSRILIPNGFSLAAMGCLFLLTLLLLARLAGAKRWWKNPLFYLLLLAVTAAVPICTSCIRLISPELNYHLIMRYQWVLLPIGMLAFLDARLTSEKQGAGSFSAAARWAVVLSGAVLLFCYGLADNIAYTNLAKKYEKTYAYCVRLLDRIEQTPGYYPGIPVALVGVVGDESFPATDVTGNVTGNMIGLSGDHLLYTGENYEAFFQNYLGATLHIVDVETMGEIYYTEEYMEMGSFPAADSTRVVNGILYVKTENSRR